MQDRLVRDRGAETWWTQTERPDDFLVAYFSAEFGLDESLPVYSGGLGVLAGDHLKAASELGVPLVGDRPLLPARLLPPAARRRRSPGRALPAHRHEPAAARRSSRWRRSSTLADDSGELVPVRLCVWRARVGRVSLYLLDTKVEGNPDWAVTDTLYGGDRANRLRQELLLGVGGVRVLRELGLAPTVFHMNEGHSAFLQLERWREYAEDGNSRRGSARAAPRDDGLHDAHGARHTQSRTGTSSPRSSASATIGAIGTSSSGSRLVSVSG